MTRRSARPPSGARPRLTSDAPRYWISLAITSVLIIPIALAIILAQQPLRWDSLAYLASVYFIAWSIYCVVYVLITWRVFGPADGTVLRGWLIETESRRRRRRRAELLSASGGPAGAVSFCGLALAAVVSAAVLPELRTSPLVITLAVLVVAASWLLITVVYAIHYAREDANLGGLRFASIDEQGAPRFSDYWYLAVQVATSFSSADVAVVTRGMRTVLTVHTLVAFVFNSALIALLVSLLILAVTG